MCPTRAALPWSVSALVLAGVLAGCSTVLPYSLTPGESADAVLRRHGPPTAERALPGGGRTLEYWGGPWGRTTYQLRFDAMDRLESWENVLDEAHFARIAPGQTTRQVREVIGPPAREWKVRYHDQTVWSYRFGVATCLLFHVGITPEGVVEDTSYGPDPMCEGRDRRDTMSHK